MFSRAGSALVLSIAVGALLCSAAPALATGDANAGSCPAATESSPGFRAYLPDCRAYEIVSQANTGDTGELTSTYGYPEGDHVSFSAFLPEPGAEAQNGLGERYLATRTASGWQDRAISPPQGEGPAAIQKGEATNLQRLVLTSDFSRAFVESAYRDPLEFPLLNETTGAMVYGVSAASGAATTVSLPDSGKLTQSMIETPADYAEQGLIAGWGMFLAGASADGSRVFFVTTARLATAPGTPVDTHEASEEIYERYDGHTYLVGVLPHDEVPNCGAVVGDGVGGTAGEGDFYAYGAISPSGSNVVFHTPGFEVQGNMQPCNESALYLRNVVNGTTVRLPGGAYGGRAGTGPGEEEVIITFGEDSIFEYHVTTGQTTDIAEASGESAGLLAFSRDGSRIYFLREGGEIFLWDDGVTRPVPNTTPESYHTQGSRSGGYIPIATRPEIHGDFPAVSSDGSHLLFIDSAQLTEYPNEEHYEAYVYDAASGKVHCVSCNPSGHSPEGRTREHFAQLIDHHTYDSEGQKFVSSWAPLLSGDGTRAVFESSEALVPQAVNGVMNVYEWVSAEHDGCERSSPTYTAVDEGCLYLLSTGLGTEIPNEEGLTAGTHLLGASENLQDVYVETPEHLVPGVDNAMHIYDVRTDGGFPASAAVAPGCEAGLCRSGSSPPPSLEPPASVTVAGAGNLVPPPSASTVTVAAPKRKTAAQVRAQKLRRALKACMSKPKRGRGTCEALARKRYGGVSSKQANRSPTSATAR